MASVARYEPRIELEHRRGLAYVVKNKLPAITKSEVRSPDLAVHSVGVRMLDVLCVQDILGGSLASRIHAFLS